MADGATEPIRFRPSAKRKAYRQRNTQSDTDDHPQNQDTPAPEDTPANQAREKGGEEEEEEGGEEDDSTEAVALAALRARNTRKGRLQGVGFRSGAGGSSSTTGDVVAASGPLVLAHRSHRDDGEDEDEEQDAETAANPLLSISSRFTHQTGILNDIDHRHMYERPLPPLPPLPLSYGPHTPGKKC